MTEPDWPAVASALDEVLELANRRTNALSDDELTRRMAELKVTAAETPKTVRMTVTLRRYEYFTFTTDVDIREGDTAETQRERAVEATHQEAPISSHCAQDSGWGRPWSVSSDEEWETEDVVVVKPDESP